MTRAKALRTARSRRGLTLVELLAALALLSVFVTAAAAWTTSATRLRAAAAHGSHSAGALNAVEELLRRDLAERPINQDDAPPAARRGATSVQAPRLPFAIIAVPEARTLTMVTASVAPGDDRSEHTGWRTVAWRFDAARGELLRGSWPYSREHAAAAPMALRDAPGVRVALRGVRAFDLEEIQWTAPDATDDPAGEPAPMRAIVARIQLETGEQAAVALGDAP